MKLSDWNKRDEKLMSAVEKGQTDRVQHLVTRKQISPFKIDPNRQITAFHQASLDGRADLVDLMLRNGSGTVNTKDLLGRTALHCAVHNARHDVTKKLLESGADVLVVDHRSWSVLHHACIGGHLGCIQLLLAKAAPVYLKDKEGVGPLSMAAVRGQATVCRILLENGADVNDTDNQNRTPLMMAAEHGHTALCEYLLTKGAVAQLADREGHDALWFAVKNEHRDVVKVLQKRGIHQTPIEATGTSGRGGRGKIVEEWPLSVGQDHAYEAVEQVNGQSKTPSIGLPPTNSTPTGSIASRERMPSPTTEESPIEGRDRGQETQREDEEGEETSYYSQIEELDGARTPGDEKKKKKMDFSGESFRFFVDEAFGLRASSDEGVAAAGTTGEAEILRPSEEKPLEDTTLHGGSTGSLVETQPVEAVEEEKSAALIRSFMTDSSDVTSGEPEVTTSDDLERGVTPCDDVTGHVDDVTMAKEIVESVIRGIAADLGVRGQADRRPTEEKEEKEEEDGTDHFVVDVQVTMPTETDHGREMTPAPAKRDDAHVPDEKTIQVDLVQQSVTSPQRPAAEAGEREDEEEKEEEEEERRIAPPPLGEWPSSFSQLINSEDDLRELFQHISELERENSSLRRQLESALGDRGVLETSKRETEKKLSLTLNRQQWIHQELILMRRFLDETKDRISGQTDLQQRLRRAEVDMETLERHLAALINLEVEAIEEVDIYSSLKESRMGASGSDQTTQQSAIVARLERENKSLLFQLRQAIEENRQLQAHMEDVEKFVNIARELKEENEALIADYKRFRDVQEEEVSEMDELAELFKDTLEENKALQAQNEELRVKVLELQGRLDADEARRSQMDAVAEAERLEAENGRLREEMAELTDAVNRQSQTILDMDERLRAVNSHAIHPPIDRRTSETGSLDRTDEGVAAPQDAEKLRLREMYEELKAQTEVMLKELEEQKREAQMEMERVVEEFEERGTEIVHLRSLLDRKDSEIRRLTDEADELNQNLELAFDEFKKDLERSKKEREEELGRVVEENIQLKAFIEEVGKVEEEQDMVRSSRVQEVSKLRPRDIITGDDSPAQPQSATTERSSERASSDAEVQVDSAAAVTSEAAVTKASVETQVEFGDLQVEDREDSNENILADLQKAVDLTKELMEENRLLKRRMKMVNEENDRYKNQRSAVSRGQEREKELERVQLKNKELLREVEGLKRTINEQSMYLLQFGHDSNLHGTTSFPSEPIDREDDADKQQQQQQQPQQKNGASVDGDQTDADPQVALDSFTPRGNGVVLKSPEAKKRFRSKQRRSAKMLEVGNGLETSLELASESEGDVPDDDLVERESAGKSLQYAVLRTELPTAETTTEMQVVFPNGGKADVAVARKQGIAERMEAQVDIVEETVVNLNGSAARQMKAPIQVQEVDGEAVALLRQEISTKDAKMKALEETTVELMNEVERRDQLEEECEKIVEDYKALISEFSRCKDLLDLELKGDGTPFGELRGWLSNYEKSLLESKRLVEEKRTLQHELDSAQRRLRELDEGQTREDARLAQLANDFKKDIEDLEEQLDIKVVEIAQVKKRFNDLSSSKVGMEEELENLRQDLASKTEELTTLTARSTRQEESLRADNDTLRCLLESKSPQMDSDYEEHLLSEIERLSDAKEDLEKQVKEKDYQLEEVRDELLEHLDALKTKMESEQKRSARDCAELLDDQEELIEENKKLQAKVTGVERDLKDARELYEEEKVASEKSRDLLEEELERLRSDRKTKADDEADLLVLCNTLTHKMEALEEETRKAVLEKNQATGQYKSLQLNHSQLEKTHKDLMERMNHLQRENEGLSRTLEREKNAVDEINRRLTERLEILRLENDKLVRENEKLALILEMEKLKNFVGDDRQSSGKDSTQHLTKQESGRLSSAKPEERSEVGLQTELGPEVPLAEGVEFENEVQSLRSSNRKLALEVAELHCRLSQKLLPLPEEDGEGVAAASRERREPVQQILRDLARENLRHLQVMAETEDKSDHLKQELRRVRAEFNHLEQENRTLKELSQLHPRSWNDLLEALRQENTKLKEFVAVLEDLMAQKSAAASPTVSSSAAASPLALQQRTRDAGASRDETLHIGDSQDSGISPTIHHLRQRADDNGAAMARVFQLQRMLQENDRKYRDIICTYRRHLLCSVQGTIDPEVKAALLRIIDLRCSESDL